ncbi:DUF6088 family protein [Pectobacterium brasiliense]|uniref:DUF6088 family protein n=1 Tax=Pectobacterium TaxID=122277 RepID=UPI00069345E4|nr:DUF6088 family protein [Pectobacterium brasiliense]
MTIKTVTSSVSNIPKVAELVAHYVSQRKLGKPFTLEQFASKYALSNADRQTASKALQRMVADKKVTRLASGTYYRPKLSRFGPLPLETSEIVKVVTRTKKATVVPAGAAAVNQLGLDTQLPMVSRYYVSVRTRVELSQNSVKFEYKETLMYFVNNFKVGDKEIKNTALLMWSALTYLDKSATQLYAKKLLQKFRLEFDSASQAKFISALPPSLHWAREIFQSSDIHKD